MHVLIQEKKNASENTPTGMISSLTIFFCFVHSELSKRQLHYTVCRLFVIPDETLGRGILFFCKDKMMVLFIINSKIIYSKQVRELKFSFFEFSGGKYPSITFKLF